jgi:hypothetical protein
MRTARIEWSFLIALASGAVLAAEPPSVVNDSDAARTVRIQIPGAGRRAVEMYRYFDRDRPANASGFPVAARTLPPTDLAKGVTVELPSRGVAFLTTVAGN